jgi:hypothetical protein
VNYRLAPQPASDYLCSGMTHALVSRQESRDEALASGTWMQRGWRQLHRVSLVQKEAWEGVEEHVDLEASGALVRSLDDRELVLENHDSLAWTAV